MLSSLPLIAPRDSHSLWYTPSSTFSLVPPAPPATEVLSTSPQLSQNIHPAGGISLRPQTRTRPPGVSPLAQLALDEQSVSQRKLNIQRFGAAWIRPPGIAKTYQGELDEKAEREEAEQQEMMDEGGEEGVFPVDMEELGDTTAHAEQDLDAEIPEAESDLDGDIPEGDSFADDLDEDPEVDLDADIPEAEAETLWDDSDDEDEEDDGAPAVSYSPARRNPDYVASTRDDTESFDGTGSSPQQAMFSHDESFGPSHGYDWRPHGRSRYQPGTDDSMEVDSD